MPQFFSQSSGPNQLQKPISQIGIQQVHPQPCHYFKSFPGNSLSQSVAATYSCPNCAQKTVLITKYSQLIKLLTIKISKLEKNIQILSASKQDNPIDDFQNFNMQLNSASHHSKKNRSSNRLTPFKQIQLGFIIHPTDKPIFSDETVQIKTQNKKLWKTSKHFAFKSFESQIENQRQICFKTQKAIQKKHLKKGLIHGHDFIQQISFTQLMQKSEVSLQSAKNLIFNSKSNEESPSSINFLSSQSHIERSDEFQVYLKLQSCDNSDKNRQNQAAKKIQMIQKRVISLSETIFDLKTFLLHVRHSIFQFVKISDTSKWKGQEKENIYMLGVIIKMFEYSEEEMEQMFAEKKKKVSENRFYRIWSKIGR